MRDRMANPVVSWARRGQHRADGERQGTGAQLDAREESRGANILGYKSLSKVAPSVCVATSSLRQPGKEPPFSRCVRSGKHRMHEDYALLVDYSMILLVKSPFCVFSRFKSNSFFIL